MNKIVVNGGVPLRGEICVAGSKNAALPLIFASILIKGKSVFSNVPRIGDVFVALEILSELGAKIEFCENRLVIDNTDLEYRPPNPNLISKIRASTYLIGASLSRFGRFDLTDFGGCNFSYRPIDLHIKSAIALGAKMQENTLVAAELFGTHIHLEKPSVGATVNTLIMAVGASGTTEISGFAKEPHVLSVIDYLRAIGGKIHVTDEKITVQKSELSPVEFSVIGDMIEAGTYITAGLITGGDIKVRGFRASELSSFISALFVIGYKLDFGEDFLIAGAENQIKKSQKLPHVIADPYPGFPTDLQPIIAPLLAATRGGIITDNVWQGRLGYLKSLSPFGVEYSIEGGSARVYKSRIRNGISTAPDLRGGAACLLLSLVANGISEIYSPETILRGYEKIIENLNSLGADVNLQKCK